ncbi:hypothetical protein FSARC_7898 [Fusarium sarcochroum]|uniref:Uncharacterized protein n=1 Tax=Fusarium sarcochroum TaxID=1208366 RepID=A0A8H4TUD9_9HYPO|nr:hypothetical protein FSARC_7898 [Fusarium sarcochroum]
MDITENHEVISDSSSSLASSIFLEEQESFPFNIYDLNTIEAMNMDDYQHPTPPTSDISMSMILESTTAIRSSHNEAEEESMTGTEAWTIVGSSAASETTCPAPASVAGRIYNLTTSNMSRLNLHGSRASGSRPSATSPDSHVRASDMSPLEIAEFYNYNHDSFEPDDAGFCGIGAWADNPTPSPAPAKQIRITPRQ